jgi:excisionase family DNA binding protein
MSPFVLYNRGHDQSVMKEYTGWPTKAEAAATLGMSEKTIERLAAHGRIQQAYRRIPNRRPTPVFNPRDIEKLKGETVAGQPFIVDVSEEGSERALAKPPAKREEIAALVLQALAAPKTAPSVKLYLTVGEAAEYTGLSATFIRRKIKAAELSALRDRGWKIRRADLEKL